MYYTHLFFYTITSSICTLIGRNTCPDTLSIYLGHVHPTIWLHILIDFEVPLEPHVDSPSGRSKKR